jgi:hypothetical protein
MLWWANRWGKAPLGAQESPRADEFGVFAKNATCIDELISAMEIDQGSCGLEFQATEWRIS